MKGFNFLLLLSVLVIATCGLIYELIAGTLASYLLGDSVTQFSIIIGVYLFSMGIGSYLSRFFNKQLLEWFIRIEILVGLVGGVSSSILFLSFEFVTSFRFLLYFLIGLTGVLVGLEIPLLMRILDEQKVKFKDLVSRVFTFDYIGALLASVIFPLVLVPQLGLIRTSFFFGMLNVAVALLILFKLESGFSRHKGLKTAAILSLIALVIGFVMGDRIMKISEESAFDEKIIFAKSTKYQRVIITKNGNDTRLYLNGNLQFSSMDEYRYHEALVHPVMQMSEDVANVLILGGGDGLAAREVLKYPQVKKVTLVDLDKDLTDMFANSNMLRSINKESFHNSRLKLINDDAFNWVKNCESTFDCVIIDFPDPSGYTLGKLYTNRFYKAMKRVLKSDGYMVVQSTSPFFAPKSFWCVNKTMQSEGWITQPYHCYVPSFGEWGFVIAGLRGSVAFGKRDLPEGLRFFDYKTFETMRQFSSDMVATNVEVNRLNNQVLVGYFEKEWRIYSN